MQEIYNTTTATMTAYMYPKISRVLDVHPAKEQQPQDVVCITESEATDVKEQNVTYLPLSEIKDMLKADLIAYVKECFGEDADVTGTKAEIVERHFMFLNDLD